jgi:hypothetical protein
MVKLKALTHFRSKFVNFDQGKIKRSDGLCDSLPTGGCREGFMR